MKQDRVKGWATGVLVVMVVMYVIARSYEHSHSGWVWVRAFSEAGMIGALADWFAVVALFRHPFGIPIPHTAIVKKQKNKIGAGLGRFVRNYFLTPEVLTEQVKKGEVVKKLLGWLSEKENATRLIYTVEGQLPHFIQQESYLHSCRKVAHTLCDKLADTPIEKGLGYWMKDSMKGQEFRAVLAPLLHKLSSAATEQRSWVEQEAGERAPLRGSKIFSKLTKGVTAAFSGHMVEQVSEVLQAASLDLTHPLYEKLESSIQELGTELQGEGSQAHADWARWRTRIFMSNGAREAVSALLESAGALAIQEQDDIRDYLADTLSSLMLELTQNPEELQRWEEQVIMYLSALSSQYGDAFETLINSRIEAWEAESLTAKIEESVGADLQFIRINGSLIGGLIGVLLYAVGRIVWGG